MNAEILAIGDEITSGQLLDTNSQWLSQRLEELGVRVLYHSTVGDELEPSIAVFRQAIDRADILIATGGLGPTADDLTRDALAGATGRPLELDAAALEHIRSLSRRQRPMPQQNELQALFPAGSRVIPNPHGTAPGIDLEVSRPERQSSRIFALPGVPAEMREMWEGYVLEAIRRLVAGTRVICRRTIKCFGAGESQVESMLPDLVRRGRSPVVGITASGATISLRIVHARAEGADEEECQRLIEPTAAIIRASLGNLVYGEGNDELQDVVLRCLSERHATLATVEVGTTGLIAQWLGSVTAADGVYRGGLVVGDTRAAVTMLELSTEQFADRLTTAAAAEALAVACRERFHADYGLAVGSFPGAVPDTADPRAVHIVLAAAAGVQSKQVLFGLHPALRSVDRAKTALNILRLALLDCQ